LILLCLLSAACAGKVPVAGPFPGDGRPWPQLGEPEIESPLPMIAARVRVNSLLENLPLHDKVAQLVMPWMTGGYASFDDETFSRVERWVDSLHVGGIIVSIGSPMDVAARLNRLQRISWLPLLMASDLESGTAFRLNGGTPFPTNMGVAATGSELDAYEMGRITALEGRAVGIHLTFSPVADVNNNPANPIINTRSFGENPRQVAQLVAAEVRGIQEHGMYATAKHFPGHGDTGTDSHISLPVIRADWARLDSLELVPFRAAVAAGVTAIMSAHVAMPGIDNGQNRPATVAPNILTGVLRDSLGFGGLVVTDALNMGALVSVLGAGEATVQAFLAGADLLLQPADPAIAIDAMVQAVESGRISRDRLDASVRRVLELKRRMGLFSRRLVDLEKVGAVVGSQPFQAIAGDITSRSLVLVKDSANLVDSIRSRPRRIALVSFGDDVGNTLGAELRARGYPVAPFRLYPSSGPASYDSARAVIASQSIAIFTTAVRATAWSGSIAMPAPFGELIDSTSGRRPTLLVSFGSPYLIMQTPSVGAYLLAWQSKTLSERAVAAALAGEMPITGHLPITLPGSAPYGYGIMRGKPR
jgi:beta-N-acetylhexosaminidase